MKRDDVIILPPQPISVVVLGEKYCKDAESGVDDVRRRVARALAEVENDPSHWEEQFFRAQVAGFVPAGRIGSAAGTELSATLINCFVQPIGDSIATPEGGFPGIYTALTEAAETMRRGGGVGYDFSRIRPAGAWVESTRSNASGPVSYMRVFDRSCETVESAGSRRGAQMGVLRCDHPDIETFIHAKDEGDLKNFNISVGVTDLFMEAVITGDMVQLVHHAAPGDKLKAAGAHQRGDGLWVYRTVAARDLWEQIMRSTYDHAEPGVLFLDRVNRENNLWYVETITASNPCAEEMLPPYGCCCLGSINLTSFVRKAFTAEAFFDEDGFRNVCTVAIRMLDNVLDITYWPLPQQEHEAKQKRRVGLGYLGLGDALVMLGIRYDSEEGRQWAARITEVLRDSSYLASVDLAAERGPFPLFEAEKYLASGFAERLPAAIREKIQLHGVRNSHLNAIAPTGTISLAFADNASNGIEPPFSWTYTRRKRLADGSEAEYEVVDHAYRLYREMGHDVSQLPPSFVCAQDMAALDHVLMLKAVQPHVDTSISKTVNVPESYPYADFERLYVEAWKAGLKGLATYRPNTVIGAVLTVKTDPVSVAGPGLSNQEDPNRRLRPDAVADVTSRLAYPSRPEFPQGNLAWTYMMHVPGVIDAGLFVGQNDQGVPFETWVNGADQPRGLGAIAKVFSIDMRAGDRQWLKFKLLRLLKAVDNQGFDATTPGSDAPRRFEGVVPYFAHLVRHRCEQLGAFEGIDDMPSPIMDALLFRREPQPRGSGTMAWTWACLNQRAGDDFRIFVSEVELDDGTIRPTSVWLSGVYPRTLDGLCKLLSIDMWVKDPAWIGLKLRKLLAYPEPLLDFMDWVPGNGKQANYASTIAYIAAAIHHRYKVLGLLDENCQSVAAEGFVAMGSAGKRDLKEPTAASSGRACPECGAYSLIRVDGCERCTNCGHIGSCG